MKKSKRLKQKRPYFENNDDCGYDWIEDWDNLIVPSFLDKHKVYLPEVEDILDTVKFFDMLASLRDCVLTDVIRIRLASDKEIEHFTKYQKEERRRWKNKKRNELIGTEKGQKKEEQAMWALWYSLTANAIRK